MYRFSGFDGLRGWLAWAVVIQHIVWFTGLGTRFPALRITEPFGAYAVSIFIILSGFVITHLVLEKHEPYGRYIARRFLRIYPIYFVALFYGAVATFACFDTFLIADQIDFIYPGLDRLQHAQRDLTTLHGFLMHAVLHLTMLHGAISSNYLFESQYMFLTPAWSLSLEWQFYLVAPFAIWAAARRVPSIVLALIVAAAFHLYMRGRFGSFILPSFLPGAAFLFAVGIGSRLLVHHPERRGSWVAVAIIAAAYIYEHQPIMPIAVWAVFFGATHMKTRIGGTFESIFNRLFDSSTAKHFGVPSYSTYLLHVPTIFTLEWLAVRVLNLGPVAANLLVVVGTLVITYFLSQAAFRWIETPAINAGKSIGRRPIEAAAT